VISYLWAQECWGLSELTTTSCYEVIRNNSQLPHSKLTGSSPYELIWWAHCEFLVTMWRCVDGAVHMGISRKLKSAAILEIDKWKRVNCWRLCWYSTGILFYCFIRHMAKNGKCIYIHFCTVLSVCVQLASGIVVILDIYTSNKCLKLGLFVFHRLILLEHAVWGLQVIVYLVIFLNYPDESIVLLCMWKFLYDWDTFFFFNF
jgi:hypothetical protein